MELRPYQKEAVDLAVERGNLLLAMTMGSGKTAVAISAVRRLRSEGRVNHGAVFAPKSVKYQWQREITKWDPGASVQVIDGDRFARHRALHRADDFDYTICHYHMLIHDWDVICEYLPIDFVILDEATAIKGFSAKTTKRAKVMGRSTDVRLALSGQPVENRPEELYSILQFVDGSVLGGFRKFDATFISRDRFGKPIRYRNLPTLQRAVAPVMFRRSREDIAEWLPERIEIEVPVVLDAPSMRLHEHIRNDLSIAIDAALGVGVRASFDVTSHYGAAPQNESMSLMGQVMSRLLAMRMLSSHPYLLRRSADDFDTELSKAGSEYASVLKAQGWLDDKKLPYNTAKLDAITEMVDEIIAEDRNHKVVIFSYFRPMLQILRKEISHQAVLIDGSITGRLRDAAITQFNTNPKTRVFLSSDAGAYGVDLNQGSHLICYDLPWSGGALSQRVARIDRTNSAFGQIQIAYMYGQGTIEERMYRMLAQKMKVARAFLDGEFDGKTGGIRLDLESLREFLDQP